MTEVGVDVATLVERLGPLGVEDLRPLTGGASSLTFVGTVDGAAASW